MFNCVTWVIVFVGLIFSIFHGLWALRIFSVKLQDGHWSILVHQFWLNFACSVAGWTALWFLVRKAWLCVASSCPTNIDIWDAALVAFTVVGVTGYLPMATVSLIQAAANWAEKKAKAG